jgi:hypothetical protein
MKHLVCAVGLAATLDPAFPRAATVTLTTHVDAGTGSLRQVRESSPETPL